MNIEELKNRARILFKKLKKDLDKEITLKICNKYVDAIEDLKEDLDELDYSWVDKFDEIYEVTTSFWSGEASEKEIKETIEEISEQLEGILIKLGIDIEEPLDIKKDKENITINVSQSQQQSQSVNIDVKIEKLSTELTEELKKKSPDESNLKKIIGQIIRLAKDSAAAVISGAILKTFGL